MMLAFLKDNIHEFMTEKNSLRCPAAMHAPSLCKQMWKILEFSQVETMQYGLENYYLNKSHCNNLTAITACIICVKYRYLCHVCVITMFMSSFYVEIYLFMKYFYLDIPVCY